MTRENPLQLCFHFLMFVSSIRSTYVKLLALQTTAQQQLHVSKKSRQSCFTKCLTAATPYQRRRATVSRCLLRPVQPSSR